MHDGGLQLLLTTILRKGRVWSSCALRVFCVLQFGEDPEELQTKVVGFLYQMRIDAEVKCAATPTMATPTMAAAPSRRDHTYPYYGWPRLLEPLYGTTSYGPASPAPPPHHAPPLHYGCRCVANPDPNPNPNPSPSPSPSPNPSPSPSPSPDRCVVLSEGAALVDKAKEKVAWQLSSAIVSAPIGGLLEPTPSGWTVHEERDHEAANMGRRSSSPG